MREGSAGMPTGRVFGAVSLPLFGTTCSCMCLSELACDSVTAMSQPPPYRIQFFPDRLKKKEPATPLIEREVYGHCQIMNVWVGPCCAVVPGPLR